MTNAIAYRASSIAANAVEEMRLALGRGGTRPTDADMETQFAIGAALAAMQADPAPSVGPLLPDGARPDKTPALLKRTPTQSLREQLIARDEPDAQPPRPADTGADPVATAAE